MDWQGNGTVGCGDISTDGREDEKRRGGGVRRKRHHTLSKIINRLGAEHQVMWDHVQSGIFHPCIDQLLHMATDLVDHLRGCLR